MRLRLVTALALGAGLAHAASDAADRLAAAAQTFNGSDGHSATKPSRRIF